MNPSVYMVQQFSFIFYIHTVQLSDVHVDAVAPGNETGESTEHKLITRPVYSNMEAIEMTATGKVF